MKASAAFLLLTAVFAPLSADITPKYAHAIFGFGDTTISYEIGSVDTIAQTALDSAAYGTQAVGVAAEGSQELKESVLDAIVWRLTKRMASKMVESTTTWIQNGGPNGGPMFVQDFGQFLTDVADETAGSFIEGSELSALCKPFELQIRGALEFEYGLSRAHDIPRCTLSGAYKNSVNFAAGFAETFGLGGAFAGLENHGADEIDTNADWSNWLQMSVNQNNNPYGAYITAKRSLEAKIVDAEGNETKLLEFGGGFFSHKECDANGENCQVVTPGQTIGNQLSSALEIGGRTLVEADEISELVDVLLGTVVTSIFDPNNRNNGGLAQYNAPANANDSVESYDGINYAEEFSSHDNPLDNANLAILNNYDKLIRLQDQAFTLYHGLFENLNQCTRVTVIYTCTKESSSGSQQERSCSAVTVPGYTLVEQNDRDDEELIDETPEYNLLGNDYEQVVEELNRLNQILTDLYDNRAAAAEARTVAELQIAQQTYNGWLNSPALYDRINIGEVQDYEQSLNANINLSCLPLPSSNLNNDNGNNTNSSTATIPSTATDISDIETTFPEPTDLETTFQEQTNLQTTNTSSPSVDWKIEHDPGRFFSVPIAFGSIISTEEDTLSVQFIDTDNASVSLFSDMIDDITIAVYVDGDDGRTLEITPKTDRAKTASFRDLVEDTIENLSFSLSLPLFTPFDERNYILTVEPK